MSTKYKLRITGDPTCLERNTRNNFMKYTLKTITLPTCKFGLKLIYSALRRTTI